MNEQFVIFSRVLLEINSIKCQLLFSLHICILLLFIWIFFFGEIFMNYYRDDKMYVKCKTYVFCVMTQTRTYITFLPHCNRYNVGPSLRTFFLSNAPTLC